MRARNYGGLHVDKFDILPYRHFWYSKILQNCLSEDFRYGFEFVKKRTEGGLVGICTSPALLFIILTVMFI